MLVYSFSFYWIFLRRSEVVESEESGHRGVSAANRGGEGFDTIETQKNDCQEVW